MRWLYFFWGLSVGLTPWFYSNVTPFWVGWIPMLATTGLVALQVERRIIKQQNNNSKGKENHEM